MKLEFRTSIALFILSVTAAALPAGATETEAVRVTIPFAFTAGTASLPAGDYIVSEPFGSHVLTIGGKGGSAILVGMPQIAGSDPRASALTFGRTSKGNTLLEVQMSGRSPMILNHTSAGK
jgi:hypothetical protein